MNDMKSFFLPADEIAEDAEVASSAKMMDNVGISFTGLCLEQLS